MTELARGAAPHNRKLRVAVQSTSRAGHVIGYKYLSEYYCERHTQPPDSGALWSRKSGEGLCLPHGNEGI